MMNESKIGSFWAVLLVPFLGINLAQGRT
jgi:hypothetical protein